MSVLLFGPATLPSHTSAPSPIKLIQCTHKHLFYLCQAAIHQTVRALARFIIEAQLTASANRTEYSHASADIFEFNKRALECWITTEPHPRSSSQLLPTYVLVWFVPVESQNKCENSMTANKSLHKFFGSVLIHKGRNVTIILYIHK